MRLLCSYRNALASFLAAGAQLMGQTMPPPSTIALPVFQQSFTTGMVGFTLNQTARLNVLNLNFAPVTSVAIPANCTVQLQFFDDKNNLLKQFVVPNFAPGTAASFDLKREAVADPAAGRAQIRGVVVVSPSPSPLASPIAVGYCSVMTTLEIFDNTTGSTVALTSDTRAMGLPGGIGIPMGAPVQ